VNRALGFLSIAFLVLGACGLVLGGASALLWSHIPNHDDADPSMLYSDPEHQVTILGNDSARQVSSNEWRLKLRESHSLEKRTTGRLAVTLSLAGVLIIALGILLRIKTNLKNTMGGREQRQP
jgi:hypothetical protein